MNAHTRILIAYDGSADADAALELTAAIFPGARAKVLSVVEPRAADPRRAAGSGGPSAVSGHRDVDERTAAAARETARHGAELAAGLGLEAEPCWLADGRSAWEAIVDTAAREDVDVIVTGSRGTAGSRPAMSGSVSERVVDHAHHLVLVVSSASNPAEHLAAPDARSPGPRVTDGRAARRRRRRRRESTSQDVGLRSQVVPLDEVR
jgi:nucleotide-binding universal stress UspA family protein